MDQIKHKRYRVEGITPKGFLFKAHYWTLPSAKKVLREFRKLGYKLDGIRDLRTGELHRYE